MSIKLWINPYLRKFTDDHKMVEVTGETIADCLDDLIRRYPNAKQHLFDENGKLLNYYNIYTNTDSYSAEELTRPVKDGDELHVILIIAGG